VAEAVVAAAIIGLTCGCASGGHQAPPSGSHSPAASPSASPTVATGAQLAGLLPPHTPLPAGWSMPHGVPDHATTFGKPFAALGPIPANMNACTNWGVALDPQALTFVWEASYASTEALPPHLPGSTTPVDLQIAAFPAGDAARQLARDAAFARRCGAYHDPADGSPITVTAASAPGLGTQSLYVQLVNVYPFGGTTVHAHADVLLVQVGNDMIGVGQSGNTSNPLQPVVPFSDLRQVALQLIGAVTSTTRN
jgi:hypothetical protein